MHLTVLLVSAIAFLNTFCIATPLSDTAYVLHEKRTSTASSSALAKRSELDGNLVLPIRIGLTQSNLHNGHDFLMDVSYPSSPNYGKHWTAEEVHAAFAPSIETFEAVHEWLVAAGISEGRLTVSDNRGWLGFDASVDEAQSLFHTEYYQEDHHTEDKYLVRCDEYYLPKHIRPHVDYITPGVKGHVYQRVTSEVGKLSRRSMFGGHVPPGSISPDVHTKLHDDIANTNCSTVVVNADCLRTLYNIPPLNISRKLNPSNSLGIFAEGDTYDQADLNMFFENIATFIPKGTRPDADPIDGGVVPTSQKNGGFNSMLQLSLLYSLTYPQPIGIYQTDDPYWVNQTYEPTAGTWDTFLDALDGSFCSYKAYGQKGDNNTIDPIYPDTHDPKGYQGPLQCGKYTPPNVITIIYLEAEADLPVNYLERQCNEWMKLGLQGTTVLFLSGDTGVAVYPGADGKEVADGCLGDGNIFSTEGPASCPYVLVVGATQIKPNVSASAPNAEEAVFMPYPGITLNYTSGGGFSNIFARPDYQKDAVENYFKTADPPYPYYSTTKEVNVGKNGGLYNRAGRAYPDVSANGAGFDCYLQGELSRLRGTEMATTVWGAVVTLLNEDRLAAGKSPVGFINPTLYANAWALNDIVDGSNNGCGTEYGFKTTPGYDPVTGLGTPDYEKLHKLFMSMP